MTNEIQQTRYDRLMRRVAGIIGPGSKVSEVLTELFPTLDVENVPGELLFLSGWQLGLGGGTLQGGALNRAKWQLVNPVGSGMLVVPTSLVFSSNVVTEISINITETLFVSAPGTEVKRDTRVGVGQTVAEIHQADTVAPTSPNYVLRIVAQSMNQLQDPNGLAVLAPGSAMEIGMETVNKDLAVGFMWRERVAEVSELAFS